MRFKYLLIVFVTLIFIVVGAWQMPFLQAESDTEANNEQNIAETAASSNEPTQPTNKDAVQDDSPGLTLEREGKSSSPAALPETDSDNEDRNETVPTDETVPADESVPTAADLANPTAIVETVAGFAQKQEAQLLGQPGWIYTVEQLTFHRPSNLYAEDTLILETWNRVDERGLITQSIGHLQTVEGATRQISLMYEGRAINLMASNGELEVFREWRSSSPQTIHFPLSHVVKLIQELGLSERSILTANLTDDLLYIITLEHMEAEPITNGVGFPEQTITSMKTELVFDWQGEQLLAQEVWLLVDEEWIPTDKLEYLQIEFLTDLPDNAERLFIDAMNIAGEN